MAVIVQDSFNRANSTTTLGSTETGQVWQKFNASAVWGIQSNMAYPVTNTWDDPIYVETGKSDNIAVQVKVSTHHHQGQIYWRFTGTGRNYFCLQGGDVMQVVNDAWTNVGTITIGSGDTFRVELRGNEHKIFVNGTLSLTINNANHVTGTKAGFMGNDLTFRLDDFLVEDFVPTGTTTTISETFADATYEFPSTNDATYFWTRRTTGAGGAAVNNIQPNNKGVISSTAGTTFTLAVPANATGARVEVDYQVSSEVDYDFFRIQLNGTQTVSASGTVAKTTYVSTALAANANHTLKLIYLKDDSTDIGDDTVYITAIRLIYSLPVTGGATPIMQMKLSGIDIPVYAIADIPAGQNRFTISTPEGLGAVELVATTHASASKVRINTSRGIMAIKKL